eukprot:scaffold4921_cov61-Phaeocystis_antarctica.AAC.1
MPSASAASCATRLEPLTTQISPHSPHTAHRSPLTALTAHCSLLTVAMATLTNIARVTTLTTFCSLLTAHCGYGYAYQVRDEPAYRAARQRQTNLVVSSFKERRALEYATPPCHAHPLLYYYYPPPLPRCTALAHAAPPRQVRGSLSAQLAGAQPAPLLARLS